MDVQTLRYDKLYLGGEWTTPRSTGLIPVVSPNTGVEIGAVPEAAEADVDAAVAAARLAFDDPHGWAHLEPAERAMVLRRFADAIDVRKDEFAARVSMQNGMPIALSTQLEGMYPAVLLRYYADLVEREEPDVRAGMFGGDVRVQRSPIGVVGAIVPWNFPQTLAFTKIAPALAAGCTMVIKPSPETVLDAQLLAEAAIEAELPAGVLNIVPGGRELGAYLVSHPSIDKVSFTGSAAAGRLVGQACGSLLRPVTLELGGKSATIILDDVELDFAEIGEGLFLSTLANNGQTCFLGTRVLVPQRRQAEMVEAFSAFAASMTIGDSLDPGTQVGPLASERHRHRVETYIAKGVAEGGRITTGGGRPVGQGVGWFVEPTVFTDVENDATISREEIFGPVLSMIPYRDDADAVRLANESDFGLAGTVWTGDADRGLGIAQRIHTGTFGVNRYLPDPVGPLGGVKNSGIGRELGPEGLASYRHLKSIYC